MGHPLGQGDPLDKLAEPKYGWGSEGEVTKTTVWDNKLMDGCTINLVGPDSPNFDFPPGRTTALSLSSKPKNDRWCGVVLWQGFHPILVQNDGRPPIRPFARRVITIKPASNPTPSRRSSGKARRSRRFSISTRLRRHGRGDLCVGGYIEFGQDTSNFQLCLLCILLKLFLYPFDTTSCRRTKSPIG